MSSEQIPLSIPTTHPLTTIQETEEQSSHNPSYYPPPPESTIEMLTRQLQQLQIAMSEQSATLRQMQSQQNSSQGSNPAVENPIRSPTNLTEITPNGLQTTQPGDEEALRRLSERARTLSNLHTNSPKFDGSGELILWKKRIMEYLRRRGVTETRMTVDVLQESCVKGAQEYLGSLEWPIETVDQFWENMQIRYSRDVFSRMAEYEALRQKPGQTYRQYADVLTQKAYGLNIPREAQLRKFLNTMLQGNELRRFVLPNIDTYTDVRALGSAVERLVQEDNKQTDTKLTGKCRICGKLGHYAAACPKNKGKPQAPKVNQVQPPTEYELYEDDGDYQDYEDCEELEDYEEPELNQTGLEVMPAEKRPADPLDPQQQLKKLRGPGRPARLPQDRLAHPSQQPEVRQHKGEPSMIQVPLKGYQAPMPGNYRPLVRGPRYQNVKVVGQPARSLGRAVQGMVDVPAHTLMGLVLKASGRPEELSKSWMQSAEQEAKALLVKNSGAGEVVIDTLELEQVDPQLALNPISVGESKQRKVGYMPLKFSTCDDVFWGLVDTGAQVSVISAGLAHYLDLYMPDMSNVQPANFAVKGYNGAKSFMPILQTTMRLGAKGGNERHLTVQFCVLDTNAYKLLVGMDLLNELNFILDGIQKRLYLQSAGIKFSLPLADRDYAYRSKGIRDYHRALQVIPPEANNVEIQVAKLEDAIRDGMEIAYENALSTGSCQYVESPEGGAEMIHLLYMAELTNQSESTDMNRPLEMVATLTPKLASYCLEEDIVDGKNLWLESDGDSWPFLKVQNMPVEGKLQLCHPDEDLAYAERVNPEKLTNLDPAERLETLRQIASQATLISTDNNERPIRLFTGPMYAGKTTRLLRKVQQLGKQGWKTMLIKHASDNRYGRREVRTHDLGMEQLADAVVKYLKDADVELADVVAIEELHFFKDAAETLKRWQEQGKRIYATTLATGWTGERMDILKQFEDAGLKFKEKVLLGNCDVCGVKNQAQHSARITPLGGTPVGGKEDYLACCKECFPSTCVFTNPKALLADPMFYDDNKDLILATIEGNQELFCKAVQAAILSLREGKQLENIRCPACSHLHLDEGKYAAKDHSVHLCELCKGQWIANAAGTSNPLAAFQLSLEGDKLKIEGNPSVTPASPSTIISAQEVSILQFGEMEINSTLPQQQEAGGMGTASLPGAGSKRGLSEAELHSFLHEYSLKPTGDPSTLHLRAKKLDEAIKQNTALIDPARSAKERTQAFQMLLDVADVFATSLDDLAQPARGEAFRIETGDSLPIKQRPYRMGQPEVEFLNKTILGQLHCGIVRPSKSAWSSPAFVARSRPYGSLQKPKERKVIDYRKLNRVTRTDTHPLPDIPELLEWLSQYRFLGAVDLKSGYWQKETHKDDMCKTAFVTPNALHEYTRVPFGVKNAPAYFQREINALLNNHKVAHSRGFIDDLLTGGETWEKYLQNQRWLFMVLKENRWLVTISKVRLGYEEIQTLGHVVGYNYIKPDMEKVACLRRLTPPNNATQVRAFLGLVGYYRRYIAQFAKIAKPLTNLTAADVKFEWGEVEQLAFEQLQQKLSEATMLHTPKAGGRFRLYTDYSSDALGAALHQIQEGVEKPIAFASRLCKGAEVHLSSAEGELCALVYALAKFRNYVGFMEFDVITDSSALTSLRTNQNLSSKLTRWSVLLSEFNFNIIHKPGVSHRNVDGLSRSQQEDELGVSSYLHVWAISQDENFLIDDTISNEGPNGWNDTNRCDSAIAELNQARKLEQSYCMSCSGAPKGRMLTCGRCGGSQHATCAPKRPAPCYWYCVTCQGEIDRAGGPSDITEDIQAQHFLLGGERPPHINNQEGQTLQTFYRFSRGQLMMETTAGYRIYPTAYERQMLIEEYHDSLMHAGWKSTVEALKDRYYWPGMEAEVKQFCSCCLSCQLQTAVFRRAEHLGGHLSAHMPRVAWSLDCAPSIATNSGERASILIAVDDFTRYVLCIVLPKLDSHTVKEAFIERILTVYGKPQRVRTDSGKEFEGEFSTLLQALNIEHIKTRPIAPWTNGRAERMVRHVKTLMRRTMYAHPNTQWKEVVPWVAGAINATISRSIGFSPHEVFFGEAPRHLVPSIIGEPIPLHLGDEDFPDVEAYVKCVKRRLAQLQKQARANQLRYEKSLQKDYAQYPVTGTQGAGGPSIARKRDAPMYYQGQLVIVKRSKGAAGPCAGHFALGATGPHIVLQEKGDSVQVQAPNGRIRWQNKANCLPMKHGLGN